ncbi:MAG: hypothetical protein AB7O63_03340 [Reyranellaceae bacterium]
MGLDAETLELLGHDGSGAVFLERGLRVRMQIAPPLRHVSLQAFDLGNGLHQGLAASGSRKWQAAK